MTLNDLEGQFSCWKVGNVCDPMSWNVAFSYSFEIIISAEFLSLVIVTKMEDY